MNPDSITFKFTIGKKKVFVKFYPVSLACAWRCEVWRGSGRDRLSRYWSLPYGEKTPSLTTARKYLRAFLKDPRGEK